MEAPPIMNYGDLRRLILSWVSPYAGSEPGTVWIYGEVDNQVDGIPDTAQLATLKDYLIYDPETKV